jgi:hypothetical protein
MKFLILSPGSNSKSAKNKQLVRSHATAYQWKQMPKRRPRTLCLSEGRPERLQSPLKPASDAQIDTEPVSEQAVPQPELCSVLGAGWIDPFETFDNPPNLQLDRSIVGELTHISIHSTQALFGASLGDKSEAGTLSINWHSHMSSHRIRADALLLAAAALQRQHSSCPDSVYDKIYGRVIGHIRRRLAVLDSQPFSSADEYIVQLMMVQMWKTTVPARMKGTAGGPRQGPLQKLQSIDYGAVGDPPASAISTVLAFANSLGRIEDPKPCGIAAVLSLYVLSHKIHVGGQFIWAQLIPGSRYSIIAGSKTLSRPNVKFVAVNEAFQPLLSLDDIEPTSPRDDGFAILTNTGHSPAMSSLIEALEHGRMLP